MRLPRPGGPAPPLAGLYRPEIKRTLDPVLDPFSTRFASFVLGIGTGRLREPQMARASGAGRVLGSTGRCGAVRNGLGPRRDSNLRFANGLVLVRACIKIEDRKFRLRQAVASMGDRLLQVG